MAYVDVKNQFLGLLNRRDITPSLVNTFMGFGIQRIQREIRVPAMEKTVELTADGTSRLAVPGDFLQVISIHTNDNTSRSKLIRADLQSILSLAAVTGAPRIYHREGAYFHIGPVPPSGSKVYINYYADASSLSADSDTNWLTEVAPALLIYAALSYAADYFLDDRKQMFEASYMQIAEQLVSMSMQDEVENASISPAYDTSPNYVGPYYGW